MSKEKIKLPDRLYMDDYLYVSPKKGNVKKFSYVLQKITENEEYVKDLYTFYKMTGLNLDSSTKMYLDTYDEIIVGYRSASNVHFISTRDPISNYDEFAAYKIVGRNIINPNRAFINKKTKDTLAKREEMAEAVPMLLKVTNGAVTISRIMVLDYLNNELKKKGYSQLPKNTTVVYVD